jgi:zinc transporter
MSERQRCTQRGSKMMTQKVPNVHSDVNETRSQTYSQALSGLACAFLFKPNAAAEEVSVDGPMPDHHDGWLWLHFDLEDPLTCKSVQSIPDLPAAAKTVLISAGEQQQLYADNACAFGVFAVLGGGSDDAANNIGFVHFAMTETLFVSGSRDSLSAADLLRDIIRSGLKTSGTAGFLEAIIEHVIDSVEDYAKSLAETLDDIEEQIVLDEPGDQRQLLGKIRRSSIRLSRQIAIGLSLIHRMEYENERSASLPPRFATARLGQRLDWLNTEIIAARERAHVLQEEAMLKTADQTNRHLQVLAIVATIFLPASLIAGIFGMNVKGLPLTAEGNGFLWSMALLVGASALVFWLLRRSGILEQ